MKYKISKMFDSSKYDKSLFENDPELIENKIKLIGELIVQMKDSNCEDANEFEENTLIFTNLMEQLKIQEIKDLTTYLRMSTYDQARKEANRIQMRRFGSENFDNLKPRQKNSYREFMDGFMKSWIRCNPKQYKKYVSDQKFIQIQRNSQYGLEQPDHERLTKSLEDFSQSNYKSIVRGMIFDILKNY